MHNTGAHSMYRLSRQLYHVSDHHLLGRNILFLLCSISRAFNPRTLSRGYTTRIKVRFGVAPFIINQNLQFHEFFAAYIYIYVQQDIDLLPGYGEMF